MKNTIKRLKHKIWILDREIKSLKESILGAKRDIKDCQETKKNILKKIELVKKRKEEEI